MTCVGKIPAMRCGMAFGLTCKAEKMKAATIMKTKHNHHRQEKLDRLGAMIVFGLFFGTLVYVILEQFLTE